VVECQKIAEASDMIVKVSAIIYLT
jgi:hypothetical protein